MRMSCPVPPFPIHDGLLEAVWSGLLAGRSVLAQRRGLGRATATRFWKGPPRPALFFGSFQEVASEVSDI